MIPQLAMYALGAGANAVSSVPSSKDNEKGPRSITESLPRDESDKRDKPIQTSSSPYIRFSASSTVIRSSYHWGLLNARCKVLMSLQRAFGGCRRCMLEQMLVKVLRMQLC
jgi:hypothetical protein